MSADKGYDNAANRAPPRRYGYMDCISARGRRPRRVVNRRRNVVERSLSWLDKSRRLLLRYEEVTHVRGVAEVSKVCPGRGVAEVWPRCPRCVLSEVSPRCHGCVVTEVWPRCVAGCATTCATGARGVVAAERTPGPMRIARVRA